MEHKTCVLIFCVTSARNISHSKKNSATYRLYLGRHVKYPLFLPGFKEFLVFSTDFRKIV